VAPPRPWPPAHLVAVSSLPATRPPPPPRPTPPCLNPLPRPPTPPLPQAKALIERNRTALDALVDALLESERLEGARVREIVEAHGDAGDLAARREAAKEAAFL
jgi:hypothetical protein